MMFWREMYALLGETQIFPTAALAAVEYIKDLSMDYMEDSKNDSSARPMGKFLSRIHTEYDHTQEVERIWKLQHVMGFKHSPDRPVRVSRLQYRRAEFYANQTGIILPTDSEFAQFLQASILSSQQRQMIIAHLESNRIEKPKAYLNEVTIKS